MCKQCKDTGFVGGSRCVCNEEPEMGKLIMMHLFYNLWEEERTVCDECVAHCGKEEVARDLNQGLTDDRDMFRYSRVAFLRNNGNCAMCDKPLHI